MRLEGAGALNARLSYTSKDMIVGAGEALKTGAAMLKQRAHDYAPLDEGDLERSIKIMNRNLSQSAARSGKISIGVGVDGDVEKRSREDVTVGMYAAYMEGDRYDLGEKSEDKNEEMSALYARDLGGADAVGRGFFSRAIKHGEPYVLKVIAAKVQALLRKANSSVSGRKGARARK